MYPKERRSSNLKNAKNPADATVSHHQNQFASKCTAVTACMTSSKPQTMIGAINSIILVNGSHNPPETIDFKGWRAGSMQHFKSKSCDVSRARRTIEQVGNKNSPE